MERKKRIQVAPGQWVEGTEVGYRSSGEHWNEYLADDGSVIRVKLIVTGITRVDGMYDQEGNPAYTVAQSSVVAVSSPEELKQQKP